jgi:hypothetical protein
MRHPARVIERRDLVARVARASIDGLLPAVGIKFPDATHHARLEIARILLDRVIVSRLPCGAIITLNSERSLPGIPTPRRIHAVLTCVVCATGVSPSQCPVVNPDGARRSPQLYYAEGLTTAGTSVWTKSSPLKSSSSTTAMGRAALPRRAEPR